MSTSIGNEPGRDHISNWWHKDRTTIVLLVAGIAAVALHVVGDVASAIQYDGHSYRDQAISELSAFGSPVRR